ncbi:plasmid replication initiator TrfA [Pseudomonas amygdali pv. morsprunorum]|uniref:plasmid replication initiator TrfA n=1 Tax=Pseudomonas amygdali TaxID=47877 RepID=UPI00288FA872|nr:plasmid replication initiator TrfA [Pseudomonas amygdali]MDT3268710.1 plasmid replication initiator TrfA [Pseudomonas amygdali pv. morsprunorum]
MAKSLEKKIKAMEEKQRLTKKRAAEPAASPANPLEGEFMPKNSFQGEVAEEALTRLTAVFPHTPEGKRAMANAILRSSLFGVVEKGARKLEENVIKATVNGLTLKIVNGRQLDQSDFDVFLECVSRHQDTPLGSVIYFTAGNFLHAIGRPHGNSGYMWLESVLSRLATCTIELEDDKRIYRGALLQDTYRDKDTNDYVILMNPKIAVFFTGGLWTGLSLEERCRLKGKQLALWLHGNYSTQTVPFPYKVETIQKNCGSQTTQLYEFRRTLKKALSDLSGATGWTCNIDPQTDLVHVVKTKAVRHE